MTRRRVAAGLASVALGAVGCGGGDGEAPTSSPTPAATPSAPSAPPPRVSGLPSEFVACMAEQGFAVTSSADIHTAPPQVLQLCFGSLHGDG